MEQPKASGISATSRIQPPRGSQLRPPSSSRFGFAAPTSAANKPQLSSTLSSLSSRPNEAAPTTNAPVETNYQDLTKSLNFDSGLPKQDYEQHSVASELPTVPAKRPATMSDIRKLVRTDSPQTLGNSTTNIYDSILPGNSASARAITPSKLNRLEMAVKSAIKTSREVITESNEILASTLQPPARLPTNTVTTESDNNAGRPTSLHDRFARVGLDSNINNNNNNTNISSNNGLSTSGRFDVSSTLNTYNNTLSNNNHNHNNNTNNTNNATTTTTHNNNNSSNHINNNVLSPNKASNHLQAMISSFSSSSSSPISSTTTTNTSNTISMEHIQAIQSLLQQQSESLTQATLSSLTNTTTNTNTNTILIHKPDEDPVYQTFSAPASIPLSTGKEEELFPGVTMSMFSDRMNNCDLLNTPTVQKMMTTAG